MTSTERRKLPIAEKESNKWLAALDETVKWQPEGTRLVTVGDSEADIFELCNRAHQLGTDLLIRAGQNRAVCEPEADLLLTGVAKEIPRYGFHAHQCLLRVQRQQGRTFGFAVDERIDQTGWARFTDCHRSCCERATYQRQCCE